MSFDNCVFKRICAFYLNYIYWHKVFIIFAYSSYNVYKICSYALTIIPDIGNLFSLSSLRNINLL